MVRCSAEMSWLRGYKTFFMLNSTEHEISTALKLKYRQIKKFLDLSLSDVYKAMSRIKFLLS